MEDFDLYWQPCYDTEQTEEFNQYVSEEVKFGKIYEIIYLKEDDDYFIKDENDMYSMIWLCSAGNFLLKVKETEGFWEEISLKAEENIKKIKDQLGGVPEIMDLYIENAIAFKNYIDEKRVG